MSTKSQTVGQNFYWCWNLYTTMPKIQELAIYRLNLTIFLPLHFFNININFYSRGHSSNESAKELKDLILIYSQNLVYAHELQKREYNKNVKPWSYTLGKKIWLYIKYIKKKYNQKLEVKFFDFFKALYLVGKQAYKLELSKNRKFTMFSLYHNESKI